MKFTVFEDLTGEHGAVIGTWTWAPDGTKFDKEHVKIIDTRLSPEEAKKRCEEHNEKVLKEFGKVLKHNIG